MNFRGNDEFIKRVSVEFSRMLRNYLLDNEIMEFKDRKLKKVLKKYADALFSEDPLGEF